MAPTDLIVDKRQLDRVDRVESLDAVTPLAPGRVLIEIDIRVDTGAGGLREAYLEAVTAGARPTEGPLVSDNLGAAP